MRMQRLTGGAIGAIDARIAKEQARQRSAQAPTRSNSGSQRSGARNASPVIRAARVKQPESKDGEIPQRGPDPKEFEPEFVIGDDELPSRSGTPRPAGDGSQANITEDGEAKNADTDAEKQQEVAADGQDLATKPPELPKDVQAKLRKLEKIESKYHGAYHACIIAAQTDT